MWVWVYLRCCLIASSVSSCVLIIVWNVGVVGLKYCVFHISGWDQLVEWVCEVGVCCAAICVRLVLRAVWGVLWVGGSLFLRVDVERLCLLCCPVSILRALFWTVCRDWMLVVDMIGDQNSACVFEDGSGDGFCMLLWVFLSAFLNLFLRVLWVHWLFWVLWFWFVWCSVNVSLGLSVSPSVLGCVVVRIEMLLIWSQSYVLYSDESSVKRVEVDLSGLSWRSFCVVQSCICWRYGCMLSWAALMLGCVESELMSAA